RGGVRRKGRGKPRDGAGEKVNSIRGVHCLFTRQLRRFIRTLFVPRERRMNAGFLGSATISANAGPLRSCWLGWALHFTPSPRRGGWGGCPGQRLFKIAHS